MKICFIAPANNYHTQKWCKWFVSRGHEVHVISFIDARLDNVTVHWIDSGAGVDDSEIKKLSYLLQFHKVRKLVDELKPDIINAHYATSYGTVTALSGIKNYVLSVWGSDIYDFPNHSFIHKWMLKFSLHRAKYLFSTSKAMANEAAKYTSKKFEITPFGVDMDLFNKNKRTRNENDEKFIIGTVKKISDKYGIDYLLRAVKIIKAEHPEIMLEVRIAGKGPQEQEYKELAKNLGIDDVTKWLGFISQEEAAKEWANMDVAVVDSSSSSESFGVSAVEAEACSIPVIISDVEGLMEATKPNETSFVVPRMNERKLADAIVNLYEDQLLRQKLGEQGRKFVEEMYELDDCFERIEKLFKEVC